MKNVELKTKKDEKLKEKVFTKNDVKGIIKESITPNNYVKIKDKGSKFCKNKGCIKEMKNIELERKIFIDEKSYQQKKKEMGKIDDFFTKEELEKLA